MSQEWLALRQLVFPSWLVRNLLVLTALRFRARNQGVAVLQRRSARSCRQARRPCVGTPCDGLDPWSVPSDFSGFARRVSIAKQRNHSTLGINSRLASAQIFFKDNIDRGHGCACPWFAS